MYLRMCMLALCLLGISVVGFGQTTRDVKAPKVPEAKYQSSKKEKKGFHPFRFLSKKKGRKTGFEESEDFHNRVKENLRKHNKEERKMQTKQYTDPTYFGHKRSPKKRKLGKKKFCKECGMYH